VAGRIMSMKNSNDIIVNRTRDLPACSAVPQPTAPPRACVYLAISFVRYCTALCVCKAASDAYVLASSSLVLKKYSVSYFARSLTLLIAGKQRKGSMQLAASVSRSNEQWKMM